MPERHVYDALIIGGAAMGSSAAWWLSHLGKQSLRVLVVERDPGYARSSTALSVASIQQQFTNAVNVEVSRFGVEFIRNINDYIGLPYELKALNLKESGYLFLAGSDETTQVMRMIAAMQRHHGAGTVLLSPTEIANRFPYLDVSDVVLGSFGPRDEGWFDNMGLLGAFRDGARANGVEYSTDAVTGLTRVGNRVAEVHLASGATVSAGAVVNAAGTRGADIMQMAGEDIPVEPRKRTVFLIDVPNARHRDAPLLVDHTGFYLRPEQNRWLCAIVPGDDRAADPEDFEPDRRAFDETIWPLLYARAPKFDAVKVQGVWAGHYAYNTFDQNAIVGPVPGCGNLYAMNGFSGHGLQQAPAMGRGIAELILSGGYQMLDLSDLGMDRIAAGRQFLERAIV